MQVIVFLSVNEVQIILCLEYNPKLHVLKSLFMIWDFRTHKVISCKFYMLMEGFIFVHDWCVVNLGWSECYLW
jgi:hypothetical protein